MSGTLGGFEGVRRARLASLLAAVALAVCGLALGGCMTPAPPPETTAETQVQLEKALEDLDRIEANKDRVDAYWAKLWGDGVAEVRRAQLAAEVSALVAKAKAEERDVTEAEIAAVAAKAVETREGDAKEIAATIAAAKDPNIDVTRERLRLALDYVSEMTEREKRVARLRAQMGIKSAAAPKLPKESP